MKDLVTRLEVGERGLTNLSDPARRPLDEYPWSDVFILVDTETTFWEGLSTLSEYDLIGNPSRLFPQMMILIACFFITAEMKGLLDPTPSNAAPRSSGKNIFNPESTFSTPHSEERNARRVPAHFSQPSIQGASRFAMSAANQAQTS